MFPNYHGHDFPSIDVHFSGSNKCVANSTATGTASGDSEQESDSDDPEYTVVQRGRAGRVHGRGRWGIPRGRGRGQTQARGACARRVACPAAGQQYQSYDDPDTGNILPFFSPVSLCVLLVFT